VNLFQIANLVVVLAAHGYRCRKVHRTMEIGMKSQRFPFAAPPAASLCIVLLAAPAARGTGLATCDSGSQEHWQPQETLAARLKEKGWQVRRIKVDGGCYEVYALDENGKRVEAYFHPRTFAPVPVGAKDHKG
jgi:hypothetical protein